MAGNSNVVFSSGSNSVKALAEARQRAIDYATRHQFYQSDRVKQFHRDLLLTETLNDRRLQVEQNRKINNDNSEDTRKFMAEIRRAEMEAVELERQRAKKREMDKQQYTADLKQQMCEMEQKRHERKLAKEREMQRWVELHKQYEQDMRALRQKQHEGKMGVRNNYLEHVAKKKSNTAKENRDEALAEEGRQCYTREKDRWMRTNNERHTDRIRRRLRRSEVMGARLAAHQRERSDKLQAIDTAGMAQALAKQEAKFNEERDRKNQMNLDMANAQRAQREYNQRNRQMLASEEKRSALETLNANKEADRAHWESERLTARKKRDSRLEIDNALQRQMAQRRQQERLKKQAEMDFDLKNLELLAQEDVQFHRYAKGVINAAEERQRNTVPMRNSVSKGTGQGVGPITGGLRANYLVPGATFAKIPEYISSTDKDIKNLYSTPMDESTKGKLNFIW